MIVVWSPPANGRLEFVQLPEDEALAIVEAASKHTAGTLIAVLSRPAGNPVTTIIVDAREPYARTVDFAEWCEDNLISQHKAIREARATAIERGWMPAPKGKARKVAK